MPAIARRCGALNAAIDRGEMVPSRPPAEWPAPLRTLLAIPEGRRNADQRSRLARAAIEEAFDGLIAALGIEWWLALLYTFWLLLVPLVLARMLAESGVYFLNPRTYPCTMLWGFLGAASLGRQPLMVFALMTAVLLISAILSLLLFGYARHRFANWPLHPVLFAVMAVWPTHVVGFSFLLGWLVKSFVMRYCGVRIYQRAKPVMLGLVADEVIGALVPVIVGLVHYAAQGSPAPSYVVIPG